MTVFKSILYIIGIMKHLIVIQNGLNGFNYFMKKVQIYLEKYLDKEI